MSSCTLLCSFVRLSVISPRLSVVFSLLSFLLSSLLSLIGSLFHYLITSYVSLPCSLLSFSFLLSPSLPSCLFLFFPFLSYLPGPSAVGKSVHCTSSIRFPSLTVFCAWPVARGVLQMPRPSLFSVRLFFFLFPTQRLTRHRRVDIGRPSLFSALFDPPRLGPLRSYLLTAPWALWLSCE